MNAMNRPDKPEATVQELLSRLENLGISREEALAFADESAAKRQHVIDVSEDDALAVIVSKLDKLQESVDSLAAKIDAQGSA